MQNFSIHFLYPWLLLLIIPTLGLTLYTHFRTGKRYRSTRNKIISIVLHVIVITLATLIISGMRFDYEIRNNENELMLLVDFSDTQYDAKVIDPDSLEYDEVDHVYFTRDDFIKTAISEAGYNNIKVGVVGFGLNQEFIAPLSFDTDDMYDRYVRTLELLSDDLSSGESVNIDTSATDINAALLFAAAQFEHPETAKIVLVSDGFETDESAVDALRKVITLGIKVDVVDFGGNFKDDGIQIIGINRPNYYFRAKENFDVSVEVNASEAVTGMELEIFDNGELISQTPVDLLSGVNIFNFTISFEEEGLHELKAKISSVVNEDDEANNEYCTYIYLEKHDKILVLEYKKGDSDYLIKTLNEAAYSTELVNIMDNIDKLPKDVNELRNYDQVILNNISNEDIEQDFVKILDEYVHEYGGGLLTFGGKDNENNVHAYNTADMQDSPLQEMLPVRIVPYRPPLGTVFIGDFSGSMDRYLSDVKNALIDCVKNAVQEGDYLGLMTLTERYTSDLQLTPASNKDAIIDAIYKMNNTGGTKFVPAVSRAITALNSTDEIANKHIVIFTDGGFAEKDLESVSRNMKEQNYDITLSMVLMGDYKSYKTSMERITAIWGGKTYVYGGESATEMMRQLQEDLTSKTISGEKPEDFSPIANDKTSVVLRDVPFDMITGNIDVVLNGYYGAKARSDAQIIIAGKYKVPIYAQWKYGKGNVGSFMCDIYGEYSRDFIDSKNGAKLIENIVSNVMPIENIRYSGITLSLNDDGDDNYNYYNSLKIYNDEELKEGEKLVGRIEYEDPSAEQGVVRVSLNEVGRPEGDCYVLSAMTEDNNYRQVNFIMKKSCAYKIIIEKVDGENNVLDSKALYNAFAFSDEYDFYNPKDSAELQKQLTEATRGKILGANEGENVVQGFVTAFSDGYDPTTLFFIIAMICFLLDIAVRKFKFKWIHEIIRERRIMKEKKQ